MRVGVRLGLSVDVEPGGVGVAGLGDAGPILDVRAKGAYRERLEELRAELAEAESFVGAGRIARLRDERERLSNQLAAAEHAHAVAVMK